MRILIAIAAVLFAGCGSVVVDRGRSATPPYGGPLDASAAVAALDDYMRESGLSLSTPSDGYAVEREQGGRALFSYDVDGRTKVSMFAADGVRDWSGDSSSWDGG